MPGFFFVLSRNRRSDVIHSHLTTELFLHLLTIKLAGRLCDTKIKLTHYVDTSSSTVAYCVCSLACVPNRAILPAGSPDPVGKLMPAKYHLARDYRWHIEQKNVDRPDCTMRSTVPLQAGVTHDWPSRPYTLKRCWK